MRSQASELCRLECDLSVDANAAKAKIAYTFYNYSDRNAYLFNILWKTADGDGRLVTDPNLFVVERAADRVVVAKKIEAVPEQMFVEFRNVPCVTRVAPGSMFTEAVEIVVPLTPWTPYVDGAPGRAPLDLPVWFALGYFLADPRADGLAETVETTRGPALQFDPFPIEGQRLLVVGPFPAVPVR